MLKSLDKGETLKLQLQNYLFLFLQSVFCFSKDYQELNMAKPLVINKITGSWVGSTMKSRYLVRFYY